MTKALDDALRAIPDRRRRPVRDDEAHAKNLEQLANQTSQQASQALKEGNRELYEKMMKHVKELLDKAKLARASDAAMDKLDAALSAIPDRRPRHPFTLRGGLDATLARGHDATGGRMGEPVPLAKKAPRDMTRSEIEAEMREVREGSMRHRALSEALKTASDSARDADREPNQSDLDAAARGMRMTSKSVPELQDLIREFSGKEMFAAKVIVAAAIQMIKAKQRMGAGDATLDRLSHALALIPDRRVTGDQLADALRMVPDRQRRAGRDSAESRKAATLAARERRDQLAKFEAQLRGVAPSSSQQAFIDRECQKIRELETAASAQDRLADALRMVPDRRRRVHDVRYPKIGDIVEWDGERGRIEKIDSDGRTVWARTEDGTLAHLREADYDLM